MPRKSAHVKNEKQYEALKDKGMSKERAAKIANSPDASKHGGEKSHSGWGTRRTAALMRRRLPRVGRAAWRLRERRSENSPIRARVSTRARQSVGSVDEADSTSVCSTIFSTTFSSTGSSFRR
jgi:hypothetical protein